MQNVMGSWDGSHDPFHAYRVRNLALSLASEEGLHPDSLHVVELAALLHDIDDHKYASRGPREFPTADEFLVMSGVETDKKHAILTIIQKMGYKEELAAAPAETTYTPEQLGVPPEADGLDAMRTIVPHQPYTPELGVVQDADRLDAMGAIGIGRTFTYGGSRNHPMFDPSILPRLTMTQEEYTQGAMKQTTINHFHEKLLKLKDLMKTEAGKKRAEGRHKFMEEFLSQFHKEWDGEL